MPCPDCDGMPERVEALTEALREISDLTIDPARAHRMITRREICAIVDPALAAVSGGTDNSPEAERYKDNINESFARSPENGEARAGAEAHESEGRGVALPSHEGAGADLSRQPRAPANDLWQKIQNQQAANAKLQRKYDTIKGTLRHHQARAASFELALRDAKSVCETLPGKLAHGNIEGALVEIEWLAARIDGSIVDRADKNQSENRGGGSEGAP